MLSAATIVAAGLVWIGLLFCVAVYGERHPRVFEKRWAIVYALSLAVHCTSWTFYGSVTHAIRSGWWLPPNLAGAMAMYLVGIGVLRRLVRLAQKHNASSLADLIAARLGRNAPLGALVTAVMLIGIVPYIALQLKAVAMSYGAVTSGTVGAPAWRDSALWVALVMAWFAMLFGTRRASAVAHNRGLVLAIAFESVFKLAAMLALGSLVFSLPEAPEVMLGEDTSGFAALIGLGALAMFTLPHQFHAGVVECRDTQHLKAARWLFPLYMALISLPILPLARLGEARLATTGIPTDLYVLALPLASGHNWLALVAFLGGLSAATCMVVVATLALSLMVAHHFIAPLRVRAGWGQGGESDLRGDVLWARRAAILIVILLAWAYSRALIGNTALADIGALSFSALAGLAPTTWIAVYRPMLGARAAFIGLAAGTVLWLYILFPRLMFPAANWPATGPFGIAWLAPEHFFGLSDFAPLTRAVIVSLATNFLCISLDALFGRKRVSALTITHELERGELRALAARFLPAERVDAMIGGADREPADPSERAVIEHELSAVIGTASARLLLDVARRERRSQLDTLAAIVDEASADLRFNQRVLLAALENMSQGICVVDSELRVVAWNRRYAELFQYPAGLLAVGRPVEELTRHAIERGTIGPGDTPSRVQRRLAHMRAGTPLVSERRFPDGSEIEIRGNPMPGGGFVATFTDVTAFRHAAQALTRANETLEQRVAERTSALEQATRDAERANETKTRFLAAVSHDLMQPLHAAQLFAHTLATRVDNEGRDTARHLHGALEATEALLGGLLDIARLDSGTLVPRPQEFALDDLLGALAAEFGALAAEHGLHLRHVRTRCWVHSDPHLLRRVLQNFLSNALRHVERGQILLGCRRDEDMLRIEIWDTGPGIAEHEQKLIFEEFRRGSRASGQGLGLGLAIAERMARLLDHRLDLRSWPGRGSVFSVTVPRRVPRPVLTNAPVPAETFVGASEYAGVALIVDNEAQALAALKALLIGWGWTVLAAGDAERALQLARDERPDIAILDYHLGGGEDGLALYAKLLELLGELPAVVVTADRDPALRRRARDLDVVVLYKPLKPLALTQVLRQKAAAVAEK